MNQPFKLPPVLEGTRLGKYIRAIEAANIELRKQIALFQAKKT